MTLYRIHWKAALTGDTGHGTGLFTKEMAKEIVDDMNRTFPYPVLFTAEPVPTAAEATPPGERAAEPGAAAGAARDTAGQS